MTENLNEINSLLAQDAEQKSEAEKCWNDFNDIKPMMSEPKAEPVAGTVKELSFGEKLVWIELNTIK